MANSSGSLFPDQHTRAAPRRPTLQAVGALRSMLACCAVTACVVWLLLPAPLRSAEPAGLLRGFGRAHLVIDTAAQRCIFIDVYVAANNSQWRQGLMYVRSMPLHEGMIFLYPQEREITMWMKNTYIPLDMVFINTADRVAHLHYDAVPHSEAVISSVQRVNQVLELNAGAIKAFGIQPGDRVFLSAD